MTETTRPLDEQYDTQMEVERDPCGAWMAIQSLAARLEKAEAERDALLESQYRAGVKAGWNAANSDNPNERYAALMEYQGHLRALNKQ